MDIKKRINISIFLILISVNLCALDYTDFYDSFGSFLESMISPNEGRTSFRSLFIPSGGRAEAMASAFTALANDVSYLESNPAGAATLEFTELAAFHNAWIADSSLDTIAYTQRYNNLGFGVGLRCFYVPFTEYDIFGVRVARSFYTETIATFNMAYNFLAGYDFKGIAFGGSIKFAYRGMPDYENKESGFVESGSGLAQSGLAAMVDLGLQTRFSVGKFYSSREPNLHLGLSILNLGVGMTGFGKKVGLDDPLPTKIAFGVSYSPIRPLILALEVQQPLNLLSFAEYEIPYASLGFSVKFTDFISLQGGFGVKGANPRISLGIETAFLKLQINANYTLDLSSSLNPFNRFSLAAKVNLGDGGRKKIQSEIDRLYAAGLYHYSQGELGQSAECWKEILTLDAGFDPARRGLIAVTNALELQQQMNAINQDEDVILEKLFGSLEEEFDLDSLGEYEYTIPPVEEILPEIIEVPENQGM